MQVTYKVGTAPSYVPAASGLAWKQVTAVHAQLEFEAGRGALTKNDTEGTDDQVSPVRWMTTSCSGTTRISNETRPIHQQSTQQAAAGRGAARRDDGAAYPDPAGHRFPAWGDHAGAHGRQHRHPQHVVPGG